MPEPIDHCPRSLRIAAAWGLAFSLSLLGVACGDSRDPRPDALEEWKAHRAEIDRSVWADGTIAQRYEQTIVALWDSLLAASRRGEPGAKAKLLGSVGFEHLRVGSLQRVETLRHGIEHSAFGEPTREWSAAEWSEYVSDLADSGVVLVQSEWHHARFSPPAPGAPARSEIATVLHLVDRRLVDRGPERRLSVEGNLVVEWSDRTDANGHPVPAHVDATGLRVLSRSGPPAFERVYSFDAPERDDAYAGIHPVLLYDLDKDADTDLVLVRSNRVLWNDGDAGFREATLLDVPYLLTETGVIADLNGDSHPDLVSTRARGDLVVYAGDADGHFRGEPSATPHFEEPLQAPSALTVGDVDADGDLDVWLAQYKPAYAGGQMPSPYYDANDGYPSYFLRNDGTGRLEAATHSAGLDARRYRRTYASSFVDLDRDGDLDLMVVSDYAGVDLYHNDGKGHFRDANDTLLADRHLFGMSSAFADYDLDGRLDFFVAGMASTTARRLEALGLWRDDDPGAREMRMRMAFGNRLYLGSSSGWREPAFIAEVARTGWTWGTTAFDFDNDGDPDLFAANGHQSGESTEDYCETFWRHDIYDGASEPDPSLAGLFEEISRPVVEGLISWDGYQKNHLLMNRDGRGFVNVAFLLGVAEQFDSRAAVSGDLDGDGRVDLVVSENRRGGGERLHVYLNRLETDHHWIAVRLEEQGGGVSPVGAHVTVRTADRTHVGRIMTGETLMGQHAPVLHFGLGNAATVESIEVRWQGGTTRRLDAPAADRTHLVHAPQE